MMLQVTPLGTCRVTNPLRRLSESGTISLNMNRIYGYVHTTAEILQQMDFLQGTKEIPVPLQPYVGPNINHVRCKTAHIKSDVYFVEISSRKVYSCGDIILQSNHLLRQIRMVLRDGGQMAEFFRCVDSGDHASRERLLVAAGLDEAEPAYQILRQLKLRIQTPTELAVDMQLIRSRLDARVVFCPHVGAELKPGVPLKDRVALIGDVMQVAAEQGFEVFDPTPLMVAFGQERAMERGGQDLAHYTPEFEAELGQALGIMAGAVASTPAPAAAAGHTEALSLVELASGINGISKNIGRMFLPLSKINAAYLAETYSEKANKPLDEFFTYINKNFSDDGYAEIQSSHLSRTALSFLKERRQISSDIKYIDFPFWVMSKFSVARRLGLHNSPPLRVFDIGVGPGYFGVVCSYLKHQYCGLDVPMQAVVPGTTSHIFDDLCGFFNVEKITQRVEAGVPLDLPHRFDLIVCLMGTFNTIRRDGKVARPWTWAEWRFFLNDLLTNHTRPDARMYFQISRDYLPPEVWERIESVASECNAASSAFMFDGSLAERLKAVP